MNRVVVCLAAALAWGVAQAGAQTSAPKLDPDLWSFTADIPLVSRWPAGKEMREDKATADLFRPKREGKLPAAVIVNSSGGVTAHTELFYGRLLAAHGVAALVVDSFTPRGVRRTTDDQSRVWPSQHYADAAAAFRWLAAQPWVDAARIIVMGMSRGGEAALHMAVEGERRRLRATDARFAAHVAITPSCASQHEDARAGAPVFFMLAELDDYTPIGRCLDYAERMRAAGNASIRLGVYPGVYHAYEVTGGILEDIVERSRTCRLLRTNDGRTIDRNTGQALPPGRERELLMKTCVEKSAPVTIGGDARVKSQAVADLLQFLRETGIIEDGEARALVPDCASLPEGILRRNCARARAGWPGDLVALARAWRYGPLARDEWRAGRLFRLAADRGHPQAQWELALMLSRGIGMPSDRAAAQTLLRESAAAGEPAAMNILGNLARDGVGQARDDADAVRWFRQAAELRHSYGLANLGRMYWFGRGGLATDRPEAVRLYRKAAFYDNPYGQLFLAEALEAGDGAPRDLAQAAALYKAAAAQDREPEAKRRAGEALKRLNAAASGK